VRAVIRSANAASAGAQLGPETRLGLGLAGAVPVVGRAGLGVAPPAGPLDRGRVVRVELVQRLLVLLFFFFFIFFFFHCWFFFFFFSGN
jgi:hypothetical protein